MRGFPAGSLPPIPTGYHQPARGYPSRVTPGRRPVGFNTVAEGIESRPPSLQLGRSMDSDRKYQESNLGQSTNTSSLNITNPVANEVVQ